MNFPVWPFPRPSATILAARHLPSEGVVQVQTDDPWLALRVPARSILDAVLGLERDGYRLPPNRTVVALSSDNRLLTAEELSTLACSLCAESGVQADPFPVALVVEAALHGAWDRPI